MRVLYSCSRYTHLPGACEWFHSFNYLNSKGYIPETILSEANYASCSCGFSLFAPQPSANGMYCFWNVYSSVDPRLYRMGPPTKKTPTTLWYVPGYSRVILGHVPGYPPRTRLLSSHTRVCTRIPGYPPRTAWPRQLETSKLSTP